MLKKMKMGNGRGGKAAFYVEGLFNSALWLYKLICSKVTGGCPIPWLGSLKQTRGWEFGQFLLLGTMGYGYLFIQ